MKHLLRSAIGPAMLGIGAWAAAGVVVPLSLDEPNVRLASPASPLWAVAGLVVGFMVPAIRRVPWLATPALLAVLPWLPAPIPQVAYIWTGRLAWFPVALPLVGAVLARSWRPGPSAFAEASAGRQPWLAGFVALVALVATATSLDPAQPGGDEPHYLVITQSLLLDGDLRIGNNHKARDYASYHAADLPPHVIRLGKDRQMYSIHAPGLAVLVAPGFAAFGYRGAQATIVLLAAITAGLVWWLGWLATGRASAAWFAWAAIVGSTTFLVQGVAIFPDGPAAFVMALAAVVVFAIARTEQPKRAAVLALSMALTALPFLHSRFASLAGMIGLIVLWRIFAQRAQPFGTRALTTALFVAPAVIGLCGWLGYFWLIYGVADPRVPYGNTEEFSFRFIPGGLTGLFFDQQYGLIAYGPVLAAAGLGVMTRSAVPLRALFVAALAYCAVATSYWMWWAGGPAPPARLTTAVLPLLAAPLAVGWERSGVAAKRFLAALLAVSLATTAVVLFADGDRLHANFRTSRALWLDWFGSVADLPRLWPSFFWRLDPTRLATEWPFAISVVIWLVVAAGVGVALWRLSTLRDRFAVVTPAVAAMWWIPATVMISGAVVSNVDRSSPLRPAVPQVKMLARLATGRAIVDIGPGRLALRQGAAPDIRIIVPRVELPGSTRAEWLRLLNVSAGNYDVRVRAKTTDGGVLTLRERNQPEPIGRLVMSGRSVQVFTLELTAPVEEMVFDADEVFAQSVDLIELVARSVPTASRKSP